MTFIFFASIALLALLLGYEYRARKNRIIHPKLSILSAVYGDSLYSMVIGSGKIGELTYIVSSTLVGGVVILQIDLPFTSDVHLLCISKQDGNLEILEQKHLEKVTLEGNFHSKFSLYASKNAQAEARLIVDPEVMAFTMDYCAAHNWEILGNQLYVVQAVDQLDKDKTSVLEDVQALIEQIQPAIKQKMPGHQIASKQAYGVESRKSLPCPDCSSAMPYEIHYFSCSKQHGILINARFVDDLAAKKITINTLRKKTNKEAVYHLSIMRI